MRKTLNIFGSTGSIGVQALEILEHHNDKFELCILSCDSNYNLLATQISKFKPKIALINEKYILKLKDLIPWYKHNIYSTDDLSILSQFKVDISLIAVAGSSGLYYSWKAIECSKTAAIANKESIVCGGELLLDHAKKFNAKIIPVDSEHNTIFQLLEGKTISDVEKIIITASGGPFFGYKKNQLQNITPEEAANHPKWKMGKKISIDSATSMNKALELIECFYLFGIKNIDAIVHPQSLIHGILEMKNGMMIAGLATNNMKIHIANSFFYPDCDSMNITQRLNLLELQKLEFFSTDSYHFPFIDIANQIIKSESHASAIIFNALGEIAVDLFIKNKISFLEIGTFVQKNLENSFLNYEEPRSFEEIIDIDENIRRKIDIDHSSFLNESN